MEQSEGEIFPIRNCVWCLWRQQ